MNEIFISPEQDRAAETPEIKMSVSSLAATSVAFRIPQPQASAQSGPTQQSGSTQGTSRGHHHHGGGAKGANLVTADASQAESSSANGSLLDVLI